MRITYPLKNVLCLFLLILLTNISTAQTQDEIMLTQTIERLRSVMEKPDSLMLADLASDNLEYVHSSGTVRDKRGFVDEFMKGWTKVTNVKFSNQTIKIVGDKAIVRHRMVADAHNPGYPSIIDIIILMVWTKEDGQWKILARQAAKLPQ
jgi:hypothetical protein